jgi:hypothetical protein
MKSFATVVGVAALLAFASQARADILTPGSDFLLTLQNTAAGLQQSELITVNGLPDTFDFGSVPLTVTVTDNQIGGGAENIALVISANQDIFPSATQGAGNWFIGIGVGGSSPMQLDEPVTLTSALMTATIPPPNSFPIYYNFIGYIADPSPWNGEFLGNGYLGGFFNSTGYNIQQVELDLTVDPVPEPLTLSFFGAGLAGAAALRRRKRAKKA